MLPASIGIAIVALLLLVLHVARRYPSAPKRVPLGLNIDGRPRSLAPKIVLWLLPALLAAAVSIFAVTTLLDAARDDHRTISTLLFITLAEVAGLGAWSTDRQIELARKQTFRIAPSRTLLVVLPLLATVALLIFIAIRDNRY